MTIRLIKLDKNNRIMEIIETPSCELRKDQKTCNGNANTIMRSIMRMLQDEETRHISVERVR
jgi:hypothetical protein